jgi:pimeloyl-ACP methyl ester carboxylesterase
MPHLALNDIQVYYEKHGKGEPLLLIHGLGSSTQDWELQIPYLAAHYQVIVFDLRGHGKTDKPNHPYTVSEFANDTLALIKALSLEKVHVVGHSLGGMIAFQLALDHPEYVKTLTIINSAPAVIFPGIKAQVLFYLRGVSVRLFGMKHLSHNLSKMLFPKPEQENLRLLFVQRWLENDPQAYINSLHAFKNWSVMHKLSEIKCPTLIITADNDYTPVSFKEFYARLIPGSKVVIIQDSRHISTIDQSEAVNKALAAFLTEYK